MPPPPLGAAGAELRRVVAVTANNIWAVGTQFSGVGQTLALHWDGTQWSVIPTPNQSMNQNYLEDVAVVTPADIWAVGTYIPDAGGNFLTLTLHWNGSIWSIVPSPNPGANDNALNGVAAVTTNDAWAVGAGVFLHWDGTLWAVIPPPPIPTFSNLRHVTAITSVDLWAVGTYEPGLDLALTEHYSDPCLTGTPTLPTTSSPTRTPTQTRTPSQTPRPSSSATTTPSPTNAATMTETLSQTPVLPPATSTPCAIQFNDVLPGSPFYNYARCLACRGIVGGYPCGGPGEPCPGTYYRPNNNVTRGQTTKIVAESAGFAEAIPSTQQTFEDIAPASTFWIYIERLSSRGIIGGYPCGGPVEPCVGQGHRPYFRPNNPVTRGQLSKIVAGAAGYTETPTAQTFEDAPPASTFYLWIERVAVRGIVGGYPCGGPAEPCLPPTNRPYFRPANNATRGQMSKIATLAFFPGCSTPQR